MQVLNSSISKGKRLKLLWRISRHFTEKNEVLPSADLPRLYTSSNIYSLLCFNVEVKAEQQYCWHIWKNKTLLRYYYSTRELTLNTSVNSEALNRIRAKIRYGLIFIKSLFTKISLVAQLVKNAPAKWKSWVWSLGWEETLEKGTATRSSILDCSLWGRKQSNTTGQLSLSFHLQKLSVLQSTDKIINHYYYY